MKKLLQSILITMFGLILLVLLLFSIYGLGTLIDFLGSWVTGKAMVNELITRVFFGTLGWIVLGFVYCIGRGIIEEIERGW